MTSHVTSLTEHPDEDEHEHGRVGHRLTEAVTGDVEPRVAATAAKRRHEHQHQEDDVAARVRQELDEWTTHTPTELCVRARMRVCAPSSKSFINH